MTKLLLRLGQVATFCYGGLFLFFLAKQAVHDLPLFTDAKFADFWDDTEAYHLKRDSRKTLVELSRQYGQDAVVRYIMSPGGGAAWLPSERGAFVYVEAFTLSDEYRAKPRFIWPLLAVLGVGLFQLPMLVAARQAQ